MRDVFRHLGTVYGLEDGDFQSTSMGASGVDVVLSPAAQRIYGQLAIECKNVEKLDVAKTYVEHAKKYGEHYPVLIHSKNNFPVLATMSFSMFVALLEKAVRPRAAVSFEQVRRGE